jgi:hypothetical protein
MDSENTRDQVIASALLVVEEYSTSDVIPLTQLIGLELLVTGHCSLVTRHDSQTLG